MSPPYRYYDAETGGPSLVHPIVDRQQGPTCGFEAVENVIQLYRRARNDLVQTHLIQLATQHGTLVQDPEGFRLETRGYRALLKALGVGATWHAFNHQVLLGALRENRVAIVVVDAHQLDPENYPNVGSGHAIVVTNEVVDPGERYVLGYVGIDSNFPEQELWWDVETLARAAEFPQHLPLLITDLPVRWPSQARCYVRQADGNAVPVE